MSLATPATLRNHTRKRCTAVPSLSILFDRQRVEMLELRVPFVRSELNMADFFTKPLAAPAFFRFRNAIMNVPCVMLDGQSSTRGCENP